MNETAVVPNVILKVDWCPWCNGTGRYCHRNQTGPDYVECYWCGGSGDKRQIPDEMKRGMVER